MKIAVAQIRSIKGDIQKNIVTHIQLINLAVSANAGIIIFPELSLTGYEPSLANELATTSEDIRFDEFQNLSDTNNIIIGAGSPTRTNKGTCISLVLFHPHQSRQHYSKQYLHPDEESFFVPGQGFTGKINNDSKIALGICYEISVPEHAQQAFNNGANIYMASVAKTEKGVVKAIEGLSAIAKKYSMTVFMSNCIGLADGEECPGKSSIWNKDGILIAQIKGEQEGILLMDTETGEVIEKSFKASV